MNMDSPDKHPHKNRRISEAFRHAFAGIFDAFKTERNLRFHTFTAILVIIVAAILQVSVIDWCWLVLAIALVIAAELINTSIEAAVDAAVGNRYDAHAKKAKDTAAGVVVVCAIFAVIIGLIVFVPRLLMLFK